MDFSNSHAGAQSRCPYCGNVEYARCGKCWELAGYSDQGNFVCDYYDGCGLVNGYIDRLEIDRLEGNRIRFQR